MRAETIERFAEFLGIRDRVEQTGVEREFFDDWLLSPTTPERSSSAAS